MHAIELLLDDHEHFTALLERVRSGSDGPSLLPEIKAAINLHKHIEEDVLYPMLLAEGNEELQTVVRGAIQDHALVRAYLSELEQMPPDDRLLQRMKILMEDIRHQADEEEAAMFPLIEAQFAEEILDELGEQMEAEKEQWRSNSQNV